MKRVYTAPQIQVVEIELESLLCASGADKVSAPTVNDGGNAW